jgi:hypothetical protein
MILAGVALILPSVFTLAADVTPTSDELADALSRPRLDWCDALVCTYRLGREYVVREVRCTQRTVETAVCNYERTLFDFEWAIPLREGEAVPPDTRRWVAAETELRRIGERWSVVADSGD